MRCGLLAMGDRDSHVMQGQAACYAACDLPHEVLDEDEVRQRYPDLGIGRDWGAYYDPLGDSYALKNAFVSTQRER